MRITLPSHPPASLVTRFVRFLACVFLAQAVGCGVSSESKESNENGAATQTFRGLFIRLPSNDPVPGLTVSISGFDVSGSTDDSGSVVLTVPSTIAGDAELEVTGPWGFSSLRIEGIPSNTEEVSYVAVLDTAEGTIEIGDLSFDGAVPVEPTETPSGPGVTPTRRPTSTPGPQGPNPKPTSTPRPKPTVKPTPKPGGGTPRQCLVCHEDRGSPRCGDPSWEAIHRAVYKCKSLTGGSADAFTVVRDIRMSDRSGTSSQSRTSSQ